MTDTSTTTLERAYEHAMAVHREARDRLVALVLARIGRETAAAYPTAAELVVAGEYDVEELRVRAQRVLDAGGNVLDGYSGPLAHESSSDDWDSFSEDMDSILLDVLAGLTYDEYSGTHSIAVPGEPVASLGLDEPVAYTVDGRPVVRVVIDVTVGSGADEQALAHIGEVLAERMGDNLIAVLGVNELMIDHDVLPWWVRQELATGEDVVDPTLPGAVPGDNEDVEDVLMEGAGE